MKKITYILFAFLCTSFLGYAQGELDALKFSKKDLHGTARSMSMGGAFGALGGDQTAISINPAGIGVYRSSEVVATFGVSQEISKTDQTANSTTFNADNLGFVGYFPLRSDAMPMINFGFTVNRQKSFDKEIKGGGINGGSLIDYIVDRTNQENKGAGIQPILLERGDNLPEPFVSQPWLSVFGYNAYLINPVKIDKDKFTGQYTPLQTSGEKPLKQVSVKEKGFIDSYDFTVGTTISNVLNVGLALTVMDIYNYSSAEYLEDFKSGGYTLKNEITTKGAGFGGKLGIIYRPINQLRIGLAYHTPTWYSLTESYSGRIDHDMKAYVNNSDYKHGYLHSGVYPNEYNLRTPDKWVVSLASVLANKFILSADYELVNYKNMKLMPSSGSDDNNPYKVHNEYISMDHKAASTVKLGMEYRFTPQFSGRLGYAWMQNPYNEDFVKKGNAGIVGSNTIFRIEGDTNFFTGGFGYRFNQNFFMDAAVVYKNQTDDLRPFPSLYDDAGKLVIDGGALKLKNNSFRGLVTLGYRF